MAKSSGLGQALYIGGYDVSGDIQALGKIASPVATIEGTDITMSGNGRIYGRRDGAIDTTVYFNPGVSANSAHAVFSALPTADTAAFFATATTIGAPTANMVAKQLNYDGTRGQDGSFTYAVSLVANGFGLEWGNLLTAGIRTDTAATNGASYDGGAQTLFGLQAYLQLTAFTGTDVTVKLQDSADNASFADITSAAFTQITSVTPSWQRIAISNAATVRRYVRVVTVTTGGFTSASFAVSFIRNPVAGQVF